MRTKYHSDPLIGDLFLASVSAYITPDRWQEFWRDGLVTTESDCMSPRLTEKGSALLQRLTNGASGTGNSHTKRVDLGDWSHPSTIGYDANDDAVESD